MTEVCVLLASRIHIAAVLDFLQLADASIAEAADRLQIRPVVSMGKDFDVYRDAKGQALMNLLR